MEVSHGPDVVQERARPDIVPASGGPDVVGHAGISQPQVCSFIDGWSFSSASLMNEQPLFSLSSVIVTSGNVLQKSFLISFQDHLFHHY